MLTKRMNHFFCFCSRNNLVKETSFSEAHFSLPKSPVVTNPENRARGNAQRERTHTHAHSTVSTTVTAQRHEIRKSFVILFVFFGSFVFTRMEM